jgi:hypothetical protein
VSSIFPKWTGIPFSVIQSRRFPKKGLTHPLARGMVQFEARVGPSCSSRAPSKPSYPASFTVQPSSIVFSSKRHSCVFVGIAQSVRMEAARTIVISVCVATTYNGALPASSFDAPFVRLGASNEVTPVCISFPLASHGVSDIWRIDARNSAHLRRLFHALRSNFWCSHAREQPL